MYFERKDGDLINLAQVSAVVKRDSTIVAMFGVTNVQEIELLTEYNPKILDASFEALKAMMGDQLIGRVRFNEKVQRTLPVRERWSKIRVERESKNDKG